MGGDQLGLSEVEVFCEQTQKTQFDMKMKFGILDPSEFDRNPVLAKGSIGNNILKTMDLKLEGLIRIQ